MTCIVGLEHKGEVWMGGDAAACTDDAIDRRREPKVFRRGELLIGFSASFRMGQLLRFNLPARFDMAHLRPLEALATFVVPTIRSLFKEHGILGKDSDDGTETGGKFLIGYRNRLFVLDTDFHVHRPSSGYAAIGAGENVALGAMFATAGADPAWRIVQALSAAEEFCSKVRGPYTVLGPDVLMSVEDAEDFERVMAAVAPPTESADA